ncbi:MAG: hypothetical protein ABMA25_01540 [Ilumatobacteraceae bacterium]
MYLFNRSRCARPEKIFEATAWAVEIGVAAGAAMGQEIAVWSSVLSEDIGRITWSTRYDTLGEWDAAGLKAVEDAAYLAGLAGADGLFDGPVRDGMVEIVHGASATPPPKFEYVTIISATATGGNFADAMAHGVALASAASAASGLNSLFAVDVTGNFGGVKWITGYPDIASMEAARHAVNSDPTVLQLLDAGGRLFADGSTAVHRRIA